MEFFTFDDDYVRRLAEGDRFTVEHYERYFRFCLTLHLRGRIPPSEIEDAIQDVHMRVLAALRKGNGPRDGHKFGAYVTGFCRNVVHERRRQHPERMIELDESLTVAIDILGEIITREKQHRVRRTLESLGQRDAEILRAYFFDDLDKDEICKRFEIDRNYLRVLIFRALEKFREKFDDA